MDQRCKINIDKVNVTLFRFEQNITNYTNYRHNISLIPPDVVKNVECIRAWVDEQKKSFVKGGRSKAIPEVGKVLETSISFIQALRSGQLAEVMKGCLIITGTISTVVGGPYSGIKGALCGILGSVLSLGTPKEQDVDTMFIDQVRVELQKFNQKLQSRSREKHEFNLKPLSECDGRSRSTG